MKRTMMFSEVLLGYDGSVYFQEVVSFLMEFKAVELLCGVIAKSRAPRATVSAAVCFFCYCHYCQNNNYYYYFKTTASSDTTAKKRCMGTIYTGRGAPTVTLTWSVATSFTLCLTQKVSSYEILGNF